MNDSKEDEEVRKTSKAERAMSRRLEKLTKKRKSTTEPTLRRRELVARLSGEKSPAAPLVQWRCFEWRKKALVLIIGDSSPETSLRVKRFHVTVADARSSSRQHLASCALRSQAVSLSKSHQRC